MAPNYMKKCEHFASPIERFTRRVVKPEDPNAQLTECWGFIGGTNTRGEHVLNVNGKRVTAHRLAYSLYIDHVSPQEYLVHTCYNRKCVNPWHLKPMSKLRQPTTNKNEKQTRGRRK